MIYAATIFFKKYSRFVLLGMAAVFFSTNLYANSVETWENLKDQAKGQTVYFNAWGGDTRINSYIDWVGKQVQKKYNIKLVHVKLTDTSHAVAKVLSEKNADNTSKGSIDLIWINGENFASMKHNGLLQSPWLADLPSFKYVDVLNKPTTVTDFSETTDGLEAPWGMAHFVFIHDSKYIAHPPRTAEQLLKLSQSNPGRFSYPQPPNYIGVTFLKQILLDLTEENDVFRQKLVTETAAEDTKLLWEYLDQLHPSLWRKGKAFPENQAILRRLLGDGEVDIAMAFDPAAASAAIANDELPNTVRSFVFDKGMIGNTHFVTIPFNSAHAAGAKVVANFLMTPAAQLRKQNKEYWGNFTVLDIQKLDSKDKLAFTELDLGIATLHPEKLGKVQVEFHASWTDYLKEMWEKRYLSQ